VPIELVGRTTLSALGSPASFAGHPGSASLKPHFIQPGKSTQDPFVDSFNASSASTAFSSPSAEQR
jgi:hypothetical protein